MPRRWAGLATVLVLVITGCGQSTSTLDSKEVRLEAETIGSLATEGRIIAEQHLRGELKESFLQVQAAELAEKAAKEQQNLEPSRATPGLLEQVEQLQTVAEETSIRMRGLETAPRDRREIQGLVDDLQRLSDKATQIEDSL